MLLTRSIRRKLALGLALVVILLIMATASSLHGIIAYRRMVNDLEFSVQRAPRRDELIATVCELIGPFAFDVSPDQDIDQQRHLAKIQYQHFYTKFMDVRRRVGEFEKSWQDMSLAMQVGPAEERAYRTFLKSLNGQLDRIAMGLADLQDPQLRGQQVALIQRIVAEFVENSTTIPDPANRLGPRLQEAKTDYRLHLRLVSVFGVFSVVILIGLVAWAYQLIFVPIRRLHSGVLRIANGEYAHKIQIKSRCEISHLARAINEMAGRIEADHDDKEREIEERSKQLVLSERLAGVGLLAAGVAHEINNPLSVIMTAAYGLEMRLGDQLVLTCPDEDRAEIHEYLGLIQSEAERCEKITKKLLDFSYGSGHERNCYDVTAIVHEVAGMVGHLSKYHDRKVTIGQTAPYYAWVNAAEIKQVILNLLTNALDATGAGGFVDIALIEYPDEVEISIQDDGCGMSAEQIQQIFEPFFTTKEVGKGTGLGLSITHRIVRDHGGTLEVASDGPGQGARFTLRLPKTALRANAA